MRTGAVRVAFAVFLLVLGAWTGAAASGVDEAGARALLDRWLAAQNDGDFAAYQAAYAQRFYGVRRSGPRTSTFDREGWVKDRERMFKKKMQVSAADVSVHGAADAAIVTFTQTWASGSYKDTGPKQLVVVREGGRLAIAREEMLRSDLVDQERAAKAPAPAQLSFAFEAGGHTWVLLGSGAGVEPKGTPTVVHESPVLVGAPAGKGLPADAAAWRGRAVRLTDASGAACDGVVEEVWVAARFYAHFGTLQAWNGDGGPPATPAERDAGAWAMIEPDGRVLVGRVTSRKDACSAPLWARDASQPAAAVAAGADADPPLAKTALAAFRELSGWARVQKDYLGAATGQRTPDWTAYEGAQPTVTAFRLGDRSFVVVAAWGGSGCGDFYGDLWAAWEVKGQGAAAKLVLLSDEADPGPAFAPKAMMDVDGDGAVELLGEEQLQRMNGATLRQAIDVAPRSFDCPC